MKPIILKKPELRGYSVAPYNFVSLPQKAVVKYTHPTELPAHNNFKNRNGKKLLSGFIKYILKAETPIIVGAGDKGRNISKDVFFFKDLDGNYAIPGNTIRGILRTNSQILSFSNIIKADDSEGYGQSEVQDSKFLFRDVAGNNALSDKYKEILDIDPNKRVSRNLRAGYIHNENGQYYIEESEKLSDLRNYFRLDEIYLRKIVDKNITNKVKFMYGKKLIECEDRFKELNKKMAPSNNYKIRNDARRKKLAIIKKCKNQNKGGDSYQPYNLEISFSFDKRRGRITEIGKRGAHSNEGYLLSGGQIDGKLSHYVVPAPSGTNNRIKIPTENIMEYIDDLILTKKMDKETQKINKGYEFFDLPQSGGIKPVFFISTDRLHFGFTPYLRMFYSKSILDGIRSEYKDIKGISYTDSIFGFINMDFVGDNYSYKSRVSFEDAIANKNAEIDKDSTVEMLLAEPKPTSYNLYLKQDISKGKKELNIYEDDFEIRGIKQYWMKNYIERPDIGNAENMAFMIHPLKEGTEFNGKIYFKNLEEDELGLILWALRLENNCYQNIGLAKPYGFGRVKVSDIELKIEDLERKYKEFSFDFMDSANINDYINVYKTNFSNKYLNGKNIVEQKSIQELMCIKSTLIDYEDRNWYRYMKLREFRYKKVLPSILEYADVIKTESISSYSRRDKHKSHRKDNKNRRRGRPQKNSRDRDRFGSIAGRAKGWEKLKNLKFD